MIVPRLVLVIAFALTAVSQQVSTRQSSQEAESVPASCAVTRRPTWGFNPPVEYGQEKLPDNLFLIGSEKLWTAIREPMVWQWRPHKREDGLDLTAKVFWFRVGYNWRTEPIPKLSVAGRRLDGESPPLTTPQGPATNAIIDDSRRGAMLTGVYVPTPGCWEIAGDYEGDRLSFIVWVAPPKQAANKSAP